LPGFDESKSPKPGIILQFLPGARDKTRQPALGRREPPNLKIPLGRNQLSSGRRVPEHVPVMPSRERALDI
jgi:hypothetical protein